MEIIIGKLQAEVGGLVLLVLSRSGQHVVRKLGSFGHRDVDNYNQLQRIERLSHLLTISQRMDRVTAFDKHRSITIRMVGQNLLGDDVARNQPGYDLGPGHRAGGRPAVGLALAFAFFCPSS